MSKFLGVPLEIRLFRYGNSLSGEAEIILLSFLQYYVIFINCGLWIALQNCFLLAGLDQVIQSFTAHIENWRMKCENHRVGIFNETCS